MMRVLLAALGLVIGWPAAAGAWHEQFAGAHGEPMVAVHHVRLTGHGGNNELSRKMLIEGRGACEPIVRDLGAEDFPRMSGEAMEQAMEKALDAMAPAARRYAEANLKKARARRQAAPNAAPEVRTIAGLQCSVHHGHVLDGVICIADPTPETVPGLDPYPIMAASENLFRGGIALEVTSWFGSVVAERVEFSLRVPERMFEIPAGFKVTMQPPLRQR